jgi:tRNA (guanine-N7-)-methyltransferase
MRQRKVKLATESNLSLQGVHIGLEKVKLDDRPTYLEIGSGKGQFITSMAKDFPKIHFIAIEVNIDVCFRILEKKIQDQIENLSIILGDAMHLTSYFEPQSIDAIYLNFSDPWPKAKHHKRRLSSTLFLDLYRHILKPHGFIQLRTDHEQFFNHSMTYMSPYFEITDISRNLPESRYMTEYEVKKRTLGPIYQCTGKVDHHAKPHL